MANATGFVILDFGSGNNEAVASVTDQTEILATSKTDSFIMADDETIDHTAQDHRYLAALAGITCGTPVAGVGFQIYAVSTQKLSGTYKVRFVWAD